MKDFNNAIFICFDDAYADYAKACLRSLIENYPNYPQVLALYHGDNRAVVKWLEKVERLVLLHPDDYRLDIHHLPSGPVGNTIVYQRYVLWSELFDSYDHILHLDVDTLVLCPLDSLFQENEFLCVSNHCPASDVRIFYPEMKVNQRLLSLLADDGIYTYPDKISDMINAGVFLIPKKYRKEIYLKQLLDITHRYHDYLAFADQSVISLWMLINNILPSYNFGFNFQTSYFGNSLISVAPHDMYVLHFSYHKPFTEAFQNWDLISGRERSLQALYRKYYVE